MGPQRSLLPFIYVALALLVADGIISLSLVSNMVAFLHTSGGGPFEVAYPAGKTFQLNGEPLNLMTNQGHTTNGAGGVAVVLIGFGGLIALIWENWSRKKYGKSCWRFYAWAVCVILSWLLTLAALIYTFVVTSMTADQTIDLAVAAQNPFPAKYPLDSWTPENWYAQVLTLPLTDPRDAKVISYNLQLQRGWRYNIIALFIVGFVLMDLVILEVLRLRKSRGEYGRAESGEMESK